MRFRRGERVGPYEIVSRLGAGGMGEVYRAHDARLGRDVALKTLLHAGGERAADRFIREARALATINHPRVCQIYEIGDQDGLPFIAMELLEGESLAARMVRARPAPSESIDIVLEILSALEALHAKRLVHRDVKPSNVFLTPHGVKLLDLGLARPTAASAESTVSALTMAGVIVGTPRYMAPEQIQGRAADARADLFAAGVMLFELLSGTHPFDDASDLALFRSITGEAPASLSGAAWAEPLDRILQRALAKDPQARHPSASAFAEELRGVRPRVDAGGAARAVATTRAAVLPFRSAQNDADSEFAAAGLTDAVTAALSRLGSMVVRSTLLDAGAALRDLDVDVVVTGALLRAGDRLRATTQLLAVPDAKVLWSGAVAGRWQELTQLESDVVDALLDGVQSSGLGKTRDERTGSVRRIQSLAVLPLENLSGDAAQDYFADGMTEALITDLAQLRGLARVIARSSVMRYRRTEKTPSEIARELKVDALVTGAVVRAGDKVRITAQLIDPPTEEQLWANRYERNLRDVLTLQADVVRDIAGRIKVTLTGGDLARFADARSVDPEAYEACLKGEFHCDRLAKDSLQIALEYFGQALQKDPRCARAHTGIARAWGSQVHMGLIPLRDIPADALNGHRTALEIDPSLIEAHNGETSAQLYFEWDWHEAERALERGLGVNGNYAKLHQVGADIALVLGQVDEAVAALMRSVELDPLDFWLQAAVGGRLLRVGRWEDGVTQLRKALRGDATLALAHQYLWTAFDQRELFDDAFEPAKTFFTLRGQPEIVEALDRGHRAGGYHAAMHTAADAMAALAGVSFVQPTQVAALYAHAGDTDDALHWLEAAYEDRDSWLVFLKDDPRFEGLHHDPRFGDLLRRMRFP